MVEQRVKDALRIADWTYVLVGGRVALCESAPAFRVRPDAGRWLMGAARALEHLDPGETVRARRGEELMRDWSAAREQGAIHRSLTSVRANCWLSSMLGLVVMVRLSW